MPLAVNLAGVAGDRSGRAFQSPYWDRLPADNAPLLAALRDEGVDYVWMNHWAGQPLMFDARAAGQDLIAYDWYDVQAGGIDRFPEYRPLVEPGQRGPPSCWSPTKPSPSSGRRLRRLGVHVRRASAWRRTWS